MSERTKKNLRHLIPYLFLLPAFLMLIGILYPFGLGVFNSFTSYRLTRPIPDFIGLENWIEILGSSDFWNSLWVTLRYTAIILFIEIPLGLAVALMLNREVKGIIVFRSLIILPLMIPPVVTALMWRTMMNPSRGILNYILISIGFNPLPWLSETSTALVSIALIDIWAFTPFVVLILLAALQGFSREPYEAALVDGANDFQVFRFLTFPMITPFLLLVTAFRAIDAFKVFDFIYATTQGGPVTSTMTLHVLSYLESFRWANLSRGLVFALFLWGMCYGITMVLIRRWRQATERL